MNHLSLFSGIGGIDLAAEWAGFHSVAMVEKDNYCQQVLRKNFPEAELYGDILEFDGTKYENRIDLISAGFPCQPFSLCGSRRGAADERALWPEVVRVLRNVKPTWFLGENVPGLLTSGTQYKGEYFNYICHSLSEMGYRVGWCLYGAKDVGAVHRRNRVFIACHSESQSRPQANSTTCTDGGERDARQDVGGSHWFPISGGNWREWDTTPILYETRSESRVRGKNDGIPHRVDRLKCLGNAVVPQQVFPILEEIARQIKCV